MVSTERVIRYRGLARRLSPRLGCSSTRCADNLEHYLQCLLYRIGFIDGVVVAKLHAGSGSGPRPDVKIEFGTPGLYPELGGVGKSSGGAAAATAAAMSAGRKARAYSSREVCKLLELRLTRLLRNFDFRYGRLILHVRGGKIIAFIPAPSIRTNAAERSHLARFFRSAPAAWLWDSTDRG
jgi:hypothetical protein